MNRVFHSGTFLTLEETLVAELGAMRAADPLARRLIVAPNYFLARHLALSLARRFGGWMGLEIATLGRLARNLAEPALCESGRAYVAPAGQELLARRIALNEIKPGDYLFPLRETAGLPAVMLETFRDFAESCVTPEHLAAAAGRLEPVDGLAQKLRELVTLYTAHRGQLTALGLVDDAGRIALATSAAGDSALLRSVRDVLLYGIYDLNPLQQRFLAAVLSDRAAMALLPCGTPRGYEYTAPMRTWLERNGFRDAGPGAAQRVTTPHVTMLFANSEPQEVREALRVFLTRSEDDAEMRSCGFLLPRSEDYAGAIDSCSEASGVSIAWAGHPPATRDPVAGTAIRLLRLKPGSAAARDGHRVLGRRDVMALAALAPFASVPDPGASPGDWDRLSLALGIRGGEDWNRRLDARASALSRRLARDTGEDEVETRRLEHELAGIVSLRHFMASLRVALDRIPERGTWSSIAAAVEQAFTTLGVHRDPEDLLAWALSEIALFDRVSADTTVTEFTHFLERVLRTPRPEDDVHPEASPLWAADLMSARGVPADVVVVAGLVDGSFPRRPRQDPLLLDHERRRLNERMEPRDAAPPSPLPLKLERGREEEFLFDLARGSARNALILTASLIDPVTGRDRAPSPFLLEMYSELTGEPASIEGLHEAPFARRLSPPGRAHGEPGSALDRREFEFACMAGAPEMRAALFVREPAIAALAQRDEDRWRLGDLNARSGILESANALALLERDRSRHGGAVSPSRLEAYARCPQLYFLRYLLELDRHPEPERAVTISAMDRGQLYHAVLRRFVESARERGLLPWQSERLPELLALMDEAIEYECARFQNDVPVGPSLFWADTRRELAADMRRFIFEEIAINAGGDGFTPSYTELSFGEDEPLVVTIAGDEGVVQVPLRGRIDRIDLDRSGHRARVVDYKTGRARVNDKDALQAGTELQLALYSRAAETFLRRTHPGLVVTETIYQRIRQRKSFGASTLGEQENRALEPALARITGGLMENIGRGRFFPFPSKNGDGCMRCDFRAVCGPGMGTLAERKRRDPRFRFMSELREVETS